MGCGVSQDEPKRLPKVQDQAIEQPRPQVEESHGASPQIVSQSPPPKEQPKEQPMAQGIRDNNVSAYSLILCGSGESGKTTFTRNMKLRFLGEFSKEERIEFVETIRGNLIETIQLLLAYIERKFLDVSADLLDAKDRVLEVNAFSCNFDNELVDDLKELWEDPNIKMAFKHRDETAVPDHMDYFFAKIDDLVNDDYLPTNDDILKARIRTVGFEAVTFNLNGANVRIYDVGGQKNERTKWKQVMDEVQGCIFCVSFADFDKPMFEQNNVLRFTDSIELFKGLIKHEKFAKGPIFFLCNKIDSFSTKVRETNNFSKVFPEFSGDIHDPDQCGDYMIEKFKEVAGPEREIIAYKIVALSQNDVANTANQICREVLERFIE